jgi:hypothetical protein
VGRKVLIAISSLLAVTTLALWIGTYFTHQITLWPVRFGSGRLHGAFIGGRLSLGQETSFIGNDPYWERNLAIPGVFGVTRFVNDGCYVSFNVRSVVRGWRFWIGLWIPFALFSAYPAASFVRSPRRPWIRRRLGLCTRCGYNLTGNVSGICPECGQAVTTERQQAH